MVSLETAGSTQLLRDNSNRLYTQVGTATPVAIQYLNAPVTTTQFAGFTPLAAETLGGVNQVLWRNSTNNFLATWDLNSSWGYSSYSQRTSNNGLFTAQAFALETAFGVDANGNGAIGS